MLPQKQSYRPPLPEGASLPWVEKYRPKQTSDLISQIEIRKTIQAFITHNAVPNLLFYGPPGTGKTSLALALAAQIYNTNTANAANTGSKNNEDVQMITEESGNAFSNEIAGNAANAKGVNQPSNSENIFSRNNKQNVLELNASDERGIEVVRERIVNFASTKKSASTGFKLIILDEADAMTQVAQGALRRIMEKYTANVRFVIICNYVSKLIPAIQSRCTRFRFVPLEKEQIDGRLQQIINWEGVNITPLGKEALLKLSMGDMRRALNILQACHAAYAKIDEDTVYNCTGSPHPRNIEQIQNLLMNDEFTTAYSEIRIIQQKFGLALEDIITCISDSLARLTIPGPMRVHLLENLADLEYRMNGGATEKVQLGAMVGCFEVARSIAHKAAKEMVGK